MILAYIPDLLFGSKVVAMIGAAGHEVRLVSGLDGDEAPELLIVDLTDDSVARIERARRITAPKLAFYLHTETDVRAQAEEAGFELVVPRSRMAREAPQLVAKLVSNIA